MSDDGLNWDELYHDAFETDSSENDATFFPRPCRAKFTIPIAGRDVTITLFDNDDVNLTTRVEDMLEHFLEHEKE